MTQAQLTKAADMAAAKLAAKFQAAKTIRTILDEVAKVLGDDFDEEEILALVTEEP